LPFRTGKLSLPTELSGPLVDLLAYHHQVSSTSRGPQADQLWLHRDYKAQNAIKASPWFETLAEGATVA
jgi:hypothetical protein